MTLGGPESGPESASIVLNKLSASVILPTLPTRPPLTPPVVKYAFTQALGVSASYIAAVPAGVGDDQIALFEKM